MIIQPQYQSTDDEGHILAESSCFFFFFLLHLFQVYQYSPGLSQVGAASISSINLFRLVHWASLLTLLYFYSFKQKWRNKQKDPPVNGKSRFDPEVKLFVPRSWRDTTQ